MIGDAPVDIVHVAQPGTARLPQDDALMLQGVQVLADGDLGKHRVFPLKGYFGFFLRSGAQEFDWYGFSCYRLLFLHFL